MPHGYAVAWGMVAELVLSHMKLGFPSEILHKIAAYVLENYGAMAVECKDYPELLSTMRCFTSTLARNSGKSASESNSG